MPCRIGLSNIRGWLLAQFLVAHRHSETMVELAEDARAIVREIAAQATNSGQDAEETVDAALLEARTTAQEMRLAARSCQRKSWIAVLLAAVFSSVVTLWFTGSFSGERVLSRLR